MDYYFSTTLRLPFDTVVTRTVDELARKGFGILTDVDVQGTMKKKLNAEMGPYRILGACNPRLALDALQAENKIGTMLPCNVLVQELSDGRVEVAAVDPIASMQAIDNPDLANIALQARELLRQVIAELGALTVE